MAIVCAFFISLRMVIANGVSFLVLTIIYKFMKKCLIFALLLTFGISIQAQSIKVDKEDKFTELKEKRTSFEKIVSDPLIMGGQMGRNIWVAFKTFEDSKTPFMIMKWCTNAVRAVDKGETVIFLDEDGNTHPCNNSQYTISSRGEGTVGALGMDLQGVSLILTGDFSAFKDKKMTDLRIYTTDGYIDFKIKKSNAKKLTKMYKLITQ